MPRGGCQRERRRAQRRHHISAHRHRLAPREAVRGKAGCQLRRARQTIGHAFNQSEPDRRHAQRRQKRRQQCRRRLMRPIAEQARQPDAQDRPVQPAALRHIRFFSCVIHVVMASPLHVLILIRPFFSFLTLAKLQIKGNTRNLSSLRVLAWLTPRVRSG